MTREELQALKLEALRTLATERGVAGAAALSRAELIDRLAGRLAGQPADPGERGAPVEASPADATPTSASGRPPKKRGPARAGFDVPSSTVHPHADELETLTMARLYAAEGQVERALEIYEKLAALDPDDEEVRVGLEALRKQRGERPAPPPAPAPPPGPQEPIGMLDLEELPETYGVDECEVLDKDPSWVFVYWEVTDGGLQAARAQLGPSSGSARLVLRLFTTHSGAHGVEREIHDVDLQWNHGRRYLPAPHPGAHLRVAVGLLSIEGYFAPIAHSSLLRVPSTEPGPDGPVEWMEVVPGRTRGRERESIVIVRRGHDHAERAPRGAAGARPGTAPASGSWPVGPGPGSGSGKGKIGD
jgi:hypothetical protein